MVGSCPGMRYTQSKRRGRIGLLLYLMQQQTNQIESNCIHQSHAVTVSGAGAYLFPTTTRSSPDEDRDSMSTWRVLKFLFLYVFLMTINSSEAGCGEYLDSTIEEWKLSGLSEVSMYPVKIGSSGKVDVIHVLNRLCCAKQEKERGNDLMCNLLRHCGDGDKVRQENCVSSNSALDDADMNTTRFVILSALRCIIAEEVEIVIEGCANHNNNLFQCTAVTSMTSPSTPASTVPQTTPSLTTATATQVAKHTTSTQPITTRPTSTTTETVTSISTSTDIQTGDTDKQKDSQTLHNVEDNTSTRPVLVLSICLCLSLILNAVLVLRPTIQSYACRRAPVEEDGTMTQNTAMIQIDGDDQNDTDDDDNISV